MVNDLIFTGCVSNVQLVARSWIPKDAKNGTGEDLITDGRIAVLQLNECRIAQDTTQEAGNTLPVHGNRVERVSRQTTLTLKNNILRDNVGVMAYSGIRTGISEFKKKDTPRPQRSMDIEGDEYTINGKTGRKTDYAFDVRTPSRAADPKHRVPTAGSRPRSRSVFEHPGWAMRAGTAAESVSSWIRSIPPGSRLSSRSAIRCTMVGILAGPSPSTRISISPRNLVTTAVSVPSRWD